MKKRTKIFILFITAILIILSGGVFTYLSDSYAPTPEAISAMSSTEVVEVINHKNYQSFIPKNNVGTNGLIFYQGGKVEAEAYAPLMQGLAEKGVPSYLVDMPFNLAVFDIDAADAVLSEEVAVDNWYLAGHSLGGAMASSYAKKNTDQLAGLILLASYSAVDLTDTNLSTLVIYGTADEVMNQEKFERNRSYVPNMEEFVLEGGNHAQFGDYGEQTGDGTATISAGEQLEQTISAIEDFIK